MLILFRLARQVLYLLDGTNGCRIWQLSLNTSTSLLLTIPSKVCNIKVFYIYIVCYGVPCGRLYSQKIKDICRAALDDRLLLRTKFIVLSSDLLIRMTFVTNNANLLIHIWFLYIFPFIEYSMIFSFSNKSASCFWRYNLNQIVWNFGETRTKRKQKIMLNFALSTFSNAKFSYDYVNKGTACKQNTSAVIIYQSAYCSVISDVNTLTPHSLTPHFEDDIFKWIFVNENVCISIGISLKIVAMGRIDKMPALIEKMAWRRKANKPLSEPRVNSLSTHICATRPQWVKELFHIVQEEGLQPYTSSHFWAIRKILLFQ